MSLKLILLFYYIILFNSFLFFLLLLFKEYIIKINKLKIIKKLNYLFQIINVNNITLKNSLVYFIIQIIY